MALSREDIVDIQQVQALYAHALDGPDQSLFPKVFAKDAIFNGRKAGRGSYYEGVDAIAAWFAAMPVPRPLHHAMNVQIYEADGEVRVRGKWMTRAPSNQVIYLGDYDDVMVRTPEGWRIKRHVVVVRDPPEAYAG
jgi:3-phenylpropionate/cinnamic acid dioxygenase small subunit